MDSDDGKFVEPWQATEIACPRCKTEKSILKRSWESHCGGYDDTKYKCETCGHIWWAESIDA